MESPDEMMRSYPADEMSMEARRVSAFASAASNILQFALDSQQEAITFLREHTEQLDAFVNALDNHAAQVPLARTLATGLAVVFTHAISFPSFEEARKSINNGANLLQNLANYNHLISTKSTYDILRNYFPDSNSDTPQVFPNFTPEKVEEALGEVGIHLYNWLDATFSLLQNRFDQ